MAKKSISMTRKNTNYKEADNLDDHELVQTDLAICYGDMVQTVVEKMGLNGEDSYGTEEYQGCYLVYRK